MQKAESVARLTPVNGVQGDEAAQAKPRIAGLHEGNILWMSDDFDEYLGDEFWFEIPMTLANALSTVRYSC